MLFFKKRDLKSTTSALKAVAVISVLAAATFTFARAAHASQAGSSHKSPAPHGVRHPDDEDRGGGGQPDPLTLFNQHVELADGELYLLKGNVVMAPGLMGTRKLQPYFNVDLDAQPWLSGKQRRQSPLYMIEGALSSWRPYEGSYGQLAAEAHVQLIVTATGTVQQVITLKPIPELSSIPQRY